MISTSQISARASGYPWNWQAVLCTPVGDRVVIAETTGCTGAIAWGRDWGAEGDDPRAQQLRGLIAQRGLDGWEPMPASVGQSNIMGWFFKRPLPDE